MLLLWKGPATGPAIDRRGPRIHLQRMRSTVRADHFRQASGVAARASEVRRWLDEQALNSGDNLLQQRHQRLRRGDVRRVAGIDRVITPARLAPGPLRKLAERIGGRDAGRVDVTARQRRLAVLQPEFGLETFDR